MVDSTSLLAGGLVVADTYEVERMLGRGGMGEVWLARHRRLAGKQVAIKVLHVPGEVGDEVLTRFRREAEIAARLEHPNIVQVLDYNTLPSGQPFLVMEFLKGQSLADRIRSQPLSLEQITSLVRQVGAALQTAHAAGVVHRDLKPENIYLVPTALGDQVKVLDFGISKLADSKSVQTTDSVLIGTPLYMSPEQALGDNRDVSPQSDIFSLASICYELLAGQPPFYSENVARVVFRIAYEAHTPLQTKRPDLPPAVVAAVEHALQKDRAARTPTVDAFVAELTGLPLGSPNSSVSGVLAPGMRVSATLGEGRTFARPETGAAPRVDSGLATPHSRPPLPLTKLDPANGRSGKLVAVGLVVSAVVLSAGVIGVRQWWQAQPTPDAGTAAPPVVVVPPAVVDAGPAAVAVTPEPIDAGAPPEVASVKVIDAGPSRPHVEPTVAEAPPSADDARLLATLKGLREKEAWSELESRRGQVMTIQSRSVRAQALALVVEALCARASNTYIAPLWGELVRIGTLAQRREAKERCLALYPSGKELLVP